MSSFVLVQGLVNREAILCALLLDCFPCHFRLPLSGLESECIESTIVGALWYVSQQRARE